MTAESPVGQPVDLLAALQRSIEQARAARHEEATVSESPAALIRRASERLREAAEVAENLGVGTEVDPVVGAKLADLLEALVTEYDIAHAGAEWDAALALARSILGETGGERWT